MQPEAINHNLDTTMFKRKEHKDKQLSTKHEANN
jgi:hypothetical protein